MPQSCLNNWFDFITHYDRRFGEAEAKRQPLHPLRSPDAIRERVEAILGIRHIPRPHIHVRNARTVHHGGVTIHALSGRSWPGCEVTAIFFEAADKGPRPTVVICCGHGTKGKHNPAYFNLGLLLARQGANVLIPDNIGQGERLPMGHHQVYRPFSLGFTLQGMLVRETMAWIDWLEKQPSVDPSRIGTSGNSGGGTQTMFLTAIEPRLQIVTSSGYPSTFSLVARKQKLLCACNMQPGSVPHVDMWQLYSLFAPKPLFLFQGKEDYLFPADVFRRVANRVEAVYQEACGTDHPFRSEIFDSSHSWTETQLRAMGSFYAQHWNLRPESEYPIEIDSLPENTPYCHDTWPADALDANAVAASIAGLEPTSDNPALEDLFPAPISPELRNAPWGRTTLGIIAAQYECFLKSLDVPRDAE